MRDCIFVLGTRAQLIKVAPVLRSACQLQLQHTVWMTGQHDESIDDLIADFDIESTLVMPARRKERSGIVRLLTWIPATLARCYRFVNAVSKSSGQRPLVIVHGDTLSTWLGAIAGSWGGGDIVHLESGLSSGKWRDPFPEEMLRRLTFPLTRLALCPNDAAARRMQKFADCCAINIGENTLLDCVRFAVAQPGYQQTESNSSYFVASIHRFRNIYWKPALERIVDELMEAAEFGEVRFVLHPATGNRLRAYGLYSRLEHNPAVRLLPRMPYTEFLALLQGARAVFSDGGSNQEELSYLGTPTVLYRDRSERPDGLDANVVLRRDIGGSMSEYICSGSIDRRRSASQIDDPVYPSRHVVDTLLHWPALSENGRKP